MPELPEVEAVVAHLNKLVLGAHISEAELLRARLAPASPADQFAADLSQTRITSVQRRGKFIKIGLDNERTLLVHLRMSGRFIMLADEAELPKFTHAIFRLDGRRRLVFSDQRHFGFMKIVRTADLDAARELNSLAPEPLSPEFDLAYLRPRLAVSRRSIKEFLLDQTKVCGLGNIYACEAMFHARIRPTMLASELSLPKIKRLHPAIREVLAQAVESMASRPIHPEIVGDGIYGESHSDLWSVYGREGEQCLKCGAIIRRIPQGGRSTYYCPRCQR